ncbi:MAG: hydroxymethylbilane synthase [Thiomonas sp.]|uniref:hydroxymethylbilane synthase n=1 Tax=Thiomonas sp. TaxID=2047785 RepID=UPI002A361622|nr:hydroxymethylbilane synthase [Thiomonas sp.]MDY0331508.1 hydroxymethylbilane synthase [Thiomonas sp.]
MISTAFTPPQSLVIATRESRLALWQAEHVRDLLKGLYPQCDVRIFGMTTQGDQILDKSLAKIGGKGLFVKELEVAMEQGLADLAVHSLKDVPMELLPGFALTAVMQREDPRDAWVSPHYASLDELPAGAVVGTSSLRRESQLRARHPHLQVQPLRGNLDTRLRKLDQGQYAGILLAAAGLKRLGLGERVRAVIDPQDMLPAVGQAALGIEIRADRSDLVQALAPLNHLPTALCVHAERAVSRGLGGSCTTPMGAYATLEGEDMLLRAMLGLPDGSLALQAQQRARVTDSAQADALGQQVAQQLREQGADALLAQLGAH